MAVLIGSLALVGCGAGGAALDSEAVVGGMTISVPSGWVETDHGGTTTFDGPENEDGTVDDAIIVSHEDTDGQTLDSYANDVYDGAEELRTRDVDGSECQVYDFNGTDVAVVENDGTMYDIMVLGDSVDIDSVLDSAHFE